MRMRKRAHFDNVTLYIKCSVVTCLIFKQSMQKPPSSLKCVQTKSCSSLILMLLWLKSVFILGVHWALQEYHFFLKKWRISVFFVGCWFPCFGLLMMSALDFKARVDFLAGMICHLHAIDSPLVWHMPNSWQPAWQLNHSYPHICVTSASFVLVRMFFLII